MGEQPPAPTGRRLDRSLCNCRHSWHGRIWLRSCAALSMGISPPILSGDGRITADHSALPCGTSITDLGLHPCVSHYILLDRDFTQSPSMELGSRWNVDNDRVSASFACHLLNRNCPMGQIAAQEWRYCFEADGCVFFQRDMMVVSSKSIFCGICTSLPSA